jgi:hypothetical protein
MELGLCCNRGLRKATDLDCRRPLRRANRYVVHADEKLTAFPELEMAVCIGLLTEQVTGVVSG